MTTNSSDNIADNYVETIKTFVSKNDEYYRQQWMFASPVEPKSSWNWAAFLLGGIWMVYRKMYLHAGILFATIFVITFVELALGASFIAASAINLLILSIVGGSGNNWYKKHTVKMIDEIASTAPPQQAKEELARKGGTNLIAAWASGIFILLSIMPFALQY